MATWWNQVLIHYEDASGRSGTTFWSLADQTSAVPVGLVSLAAAVQACTNAKVKAVQLQTTAHYAGDGSPAQYPSVQDVAHLIGKYDTKTAHYDILAPKQSIFLEDNTRLDMENPSVIALVSSMAGTLGTPAGVPLSVITRGQRQWAGRR